MVLASSELQVELFACGWDPEAMASVILNRAQLVERCIAQQKGSLSGHHDKV